MKAKTLLALCALLSACAQLAPTETRAVPKAAAPAAPATIAPAAPATTQAQKINSELEWANQQEFKEAKRMCEQYASCGQYKHMLGEMQKRETPAPASVRTESVAPPAPRPDSARQIEAINAELQRIDQRAFLEAKERCEVAASLCDDYRRMLLEMKQQAGGGGDVVRTESRAEPRPVAAPAVPQARQP